jgi:hypothetical protein
MNYPIIAIVGRRGYGKTVWMTAMGLDSLNEGYPVFANYHLKNVDYTYITLQELSEFPPEIHDCVVLMDEFHMGADAYDFFAKRTRNLTKFLTQLRKRRITFIYTTQYMLQVAKRVRLQTDYIIYMRPRGNGIFTAYVTDPHQIMEDQLINKITEDLTLVFDYYDTNEIIDADGDDEDAEIHGEIIDDLIEIFEKDG